MRLAIPIEGLSTLLNSIQLPRPDLLLRTTFEILRTIVNTTAIVESLKAIIIREIEEATAASYRVDVAEDPYWGYVYVVTLYANASEALRINLELQKRHPGVPIVVKWKGATDVTDKELIQRVLEIARAGGFKAKAPPGFDAVQVVREERWRI